MNATCNPESARRAHRSGTTTLVVTLISILAVSQLTACSFPEERFRDDFKLEACEHQAECTDPVYSDVETCVAEIPDHFEDPTFNCVYKPSRAAACFSRISETCSSTGWDTFASTCYSVYECLPEESFRKLHATLVCYYSRDCIEGFDERYGGFSGCVDAELAAQPPRTACYSETKAKECFGFLTSFALRDCVLTENPEHYVDHCGSVWSCTE